jgi:hypothetical protein
MNHHTLILSTARIKIPFGVSIKFTTNLSNLRWALTEYFGSEIDYDADFVDTNMKAVSRKITYFEFYF